MHHLSRERKSSLHNSPPCALECDEEVIRLFKHPSGSKFTDQTDEMKGSRTGKLSRWKLFEITSSAFTDAACYTFDRKLLRLTHRLARETNFIASASIIQGAPLAS